MKPKTHCIIHQGNGEVWEATLDPIPKEADYLDLRVEGNEEIQTFKFMGYDFAENAHFVEVENA